MTWAEFVSGLKIFAQYGLAGLWAGCATWAAVHLYRSKDRAEQAHRAELLGVIKEANDRSDAKDKLHNEQMAEVQNRCMSYVTTIQTENRELTTQARQLIEVVSRKIRR